MVNKRFQKFLFLLLAIVTFLSFTILPEFSDTILPEFSEEKPQSTPDEEKPQPTPDEKTLTEKFIEVLPLFVFCIGVALVIIGIGLIRMKSPKGSATCMFVGVLLVGISLSYLHLSSSFAQNFFLNILANGFLVAISSGAFYFLGYVFARGEVSKLSKYFFDASAIVAFFGIIIIELLVFSKYVSSVGIGIGYSMKECGIVEQVLEPQNFFFCAFLGKKPDVNIPLWELVSFIIFGIILPFSVVFSIVFGIFFGMGLNELFGKYGKSVTGVIAFATAMFGMRQFIGPFLIDLLAYGVWGIFGVIIALIIPSMIRFTGRRFLKDIEHIKKSLYAHFLVGEFAELSDIKRSLDRIRTTLSDENIKLGKEEIEGIIAELDGISKVLDNYTTEKEDVRVRIYASQLKHEVIRLKALANSKLGKG